MDTNNIVIAVRLDLSDMDDDEKLNFVDETSRGIEDHIIKKLYPDKQHVLGYSMGHSTVELDLYQQANFSLLFARCVIARSKKDGISIEQAFWVELEGLAEETVLNQVFGERWDKRAR